MNAALTLWGLKVIETASAIRIPLMLAAAWFGYSEINEAIVANDLHLDIAVSCTKLSAIVEDYDYVCSLGYVDATGAIVEDANGDLRTIGDTWLK